jgi:protein involved in polysaccharide export with SLBB domain
MCKITVNLIILFLLGFQSGLCRQSAADRLQRLELLQSQDPERTGILPQAPGSAFESTVDPALYHVGPSDVIGVNIWSGQPVNFSLTVTPEGILIVPTVGEFGVSGKLLSDVKSDVGEQVRKKYASFPVTVSLLKPRQVVVSVIGNVVNPGFYTLSATDRADRAIDAANLSDPKVLEPQALERLLLEMSKRNVILRHRDGSEDKVDIVKYSAIHDERLDPYLREGDVVVVPKRDPDKNVVAIYGEVNVPGRYEFVQGDSLADLFLLSQGFTPRAVRDSIEFSRLSPDGGTMVTGILNLVDGTFHNIPLAPGDRIIVRARSDPREDYHVTVEGEVLYPGIYPITKENSTLSEIVRMAGGFSEVAALGSATLNRRPIRWDEVQLERLMSLRGVYSAEDSADYIVETNLRLRRENVSVDFNRLFVDHDSTQDVKLQDGDQISIPSLKNTVYVFGQILRPGHIPYVMGNDVDYYVRKGGGYTDRARVDDVRVIKAGTRQWLAPGDTEIEEGDQIWIPKEPDRSLGYYVNIASQGAAVLSVVLGMAVLIVQVTK